MRIGRTLPPAAAPLSLRDIYSGLQGLVTGARAEEQARQELQVYFQKRHCFLVSSGKAALTLILLALKDLHPDRDQVLIPAFTCYSVPSAIVRAGLKIALCDIDPETLDFDFAQLEQKLANPRLLCVIPTHLFGLPADVDRVRRIKKDRDISIVEDAAQAMGREVGGTKLGTLGDVGFFSLGRGKALTAVEGGIIVTDDENLAERLQYHWDRLPGCSARDILRQILYAFALLVLLPPQLYWLPSGLPFLRLGETLFDPDFPLRKFSSFQAGLMKGFAKKLQRLWQMRRDNSRYWTQHLPDTLVQTVVRYNPRPDVLRFPVRVGDGKSSDLLMQRSARVGLGVARTYPDAIHRIPELTRHFAGQEFPSARRAANEILTLPVHGFVTEKDRKRLVRLLASEAVLQEVTV